MKQVFNLTELEAVATAFAARLQSVGVVAFYGEMGAGKTTFISAICRALESTDTPGSPTFSIINEYKTATGKTIYHMDWYRLKDEEEAIAAGVEDALYSGHLCLVEWPEKAKGLLPEDCLQVELKVQDEISRELSLPAL